MPEPLSTIIFDLGGVVVRICRSWAEACARAGLDIRAPERFADVELVKTRHALADRYMSGAIPCHEFFAGVADATGGLYTPDEIERIHDVWVIDDEPGIADLIDALNQSDALTTACLSNTNHSHWQRLIQGDHASAAIARLQRLVSHELGHVKPDEQIYAAAESALDARPDQILFFDDLEPNVHAARARGWHAHRIDHQQPTTPQIAAHLAEHALDPRPIT